MIYKAISKASWEAVIHKSMISTSSFYFVLILRQRENSTLNFGGRFFVRLCFSQSSSKPFQRPMENTEMRVNQV